jgi:hypothetical protein
VIPTEDDEAFSLPLLETFASGCHIIVIPDVGDLNR